ncbi:MAG: lysophospholipid acyltransferase family protein [Bacteroidota bacterium]
MFFINLFSKLPFFVLYGISNFAYFVIYRVIGYRKKVVMENLQNSFPNKTKEEINQIAKNFYKHIADLFIEFLKGYSMSEAQVHERVKVINIEAIKKHTDNHQSVILVTGHIGNWEWLLHPLNLTGIPIDIVYQKLSSPFFNKLTLFIRGRFGVTPLIEKDDTLRKTIERKDVVRVLAMGSDQSPTNWKTAYWTNFLNQDSGFFTGTERIARKFDYPVIFSEMRRVKRGYYEIEFTEIAQPEEYKDLPTGEITERFIRILDKSIHKYPSDYLWSHRRWKHKRSTDDVVKTNFRELRS